MKGDNGKRARAWPLREGKCPDCERWLALHGDSRSVVRHRCADAKMVGGQTAAAVYPDDFTADG